MKVQELIEKLKKENPEAEAQFLKWTFSQSRWEYEELELSEIKPSSADFVSFDLVGKNERAY
jgi:hypothetical protein